MLYAKLGNTGLLISRLGFGASPLGDVFGVTDPAEDLKAVQRAVDLGINFFDVSPYYGNTLAEERLGRALVGRREKVFVATKCGRYGRDVFDFSAVRIKRSIDESLVRLRTDYVDLFQAHDIEFGDLDQIVSETLPALREIQQSGKARYIGITGYPLQTLISVARRARVDTILSYCHYNLLATDLNDELGPFALANGIGLINASPLHMGLLADSQLPDWHPAPIEVRRASAAVVKLCRKHGFHPAVVALAFSVKNPYVATTLVGMSTSKQVDTNLEALDFEMDRAFLEKIEQIVAPVKNLAWASGRRDGADRLLPSKAGQELKA
jgi:L-galactose dehydrogenase